MKRLMLFLAAMNMFYSNAQNEHILINSDWYVTNYSIDSTNLLNSDTLLLHRSTWTDRKGQEYRDSSFNSHKLWQFYFSDYGGVEIGWTDYVAATAGDKPPYFHQMYECQNLIWSLNKRTITIYLNGTPYQYLLEHHRKSANDLSLIKKRFHLVEGIDDTK